MKPLVLTFRNESDVPEEGGLPYERVGGARRKI